MSGERGPPSSPCFGPHGAGSVGFCTRSGMTKNLRRNDIKASWRPFTGPACQRRRLMPKSGFDEVAVSRSFCPDRFRRCREFEQRRANFRTDATRYCDSIGRCTNSGVDQKDRRTKCEDRHAVAANPQVAVAAIQPTPWRHHWRRRALNIHIRCINIYSSAGRTIRESRRWQQPHRRPRRDAHFHRADAQHQRKRASKIQSHR